MSLTTDDLQKIQTVVSQTVTQQLDEKLKNVATKDDLKSFITKDDLKEMEERQDKKYATKDDLKAMEDRQDKKFATKDDLKAMKDDQDKQYNILLQNIVTNATFDERVKHAVNEVLDEKIKNLPTKEEFFDRMDKLSGEYKKIDGEQTLQSGQLSDHDDKLEKHDQRISALEHRQQSTPTPIIPAP